MKLTDADKLQQDDAELFGTPDVSFTFTTRSEDGSELVEKEITFSHSEHFGGWSLKHYVERRCDADAHITQRNWRVIEDVHWDKAHLSNADIDIPDAALDELEDVLGLESIELGL